MTQAKFNPGKDLHNLAQKLRITTSATLRKILKKPYQVFWFCTDRLYDGLAINKWLIVPREALEPIAYSNIDILFFAPVLKGYGCTSRLSIQGQVEIFGGGTIQLKYPAGGISCYSRLFLSERDTEEFLAGEQGMPEQQINRDMIQLIPNQEIGQGRDSNENKKRQNQAQIESAIKSIVNNASYSKRIRSDSGKIRHTKLLNVLDKEENRKTYNLPETERGFSRKTLSRAISAFLSQNNNK